METKLEFISIESIQDLKVPQKSVVISGGNGIGKSAFLKEYALNYGYAFYEEHGITSGKERLAAIVEFCKVHNNVVIDDIELHLHTDVQQELLGTLHDNNSNLCIVCSTHSPSIIINGWIDVIVNFDNISVEEELDVLNSGKYAILAEKYVNMSHSIFIKLYTEFNIDLSNVKVTGIEFKKHFIKLCANNNHDKFIEIVKSELTTHNITHGKQKQNNMESNYCILGLCYEKCVEHPLNQFGCSTCEKYINQVPVDDTLSKAQEDGVWVVVRSLLSEASKNPSKQFYKHDVLQDINHQLK